MAQNNIEFFKVVASGNDFILLDCRKQNLKLNYKEFAKKYCQRTSAIGADGVLVLTASKTVDFNMQIYNADGSQAQMCGNGARCAALFVANSLKTKTAAIQLEFSTLAGIIQAQVLANLIKLKMTKPFGLKLGIPLKFGRRILKVNFINTGVPHAVIFVERASDVEVEVLGRFIRKHKNFAPEGTNVNFVEVCNERSLRLRTYERGVEAETYACGTGSVAAALILLIKQDFALNRPRVVSVETKSKEILKVYCQFDKNRQVQDVWLEGKANIVYQGKLS